MIKKQSLTTISILLAVTILQTLMTTPTQGASNTCWTTAHGYGISTRFPYGHSNFLRVDIPTDEFWRVRSIYYDGQLVGPYDTNKVSGDISSRSGDSYTDLRVASRWAGYKWSLRSPDASHWVVEYFCKRGGGGSW